MKDTPRSRAIRLGIFQRANCEKCAADCIETVGEWVLTGLCPKCEPKMDRKAQQRIAGR